MHLKIKQATNKGYDIAKVGDYVDFNYPDSKTRRGRVGHGISNTLATVGVGGVVVEVRKNEQYKT